MLRNKELRQAAAIFCALSACLTAAGFAVRKICIWNQPQTFSHPAAAHSSARDSWSSVGSGLNWEALSL